MRGLMKGLTAFSIISVLVVSLFLIGGVFKAQSAYAQHDATVTISPDIANCNQLGNTFTVNVENNVGSADKILQVEIYKATAGLSNFVCGAAPTGWTLFSFVDRCIYVTELGSAAKISPGASLDFTFQATMSSDSCTSSFTVVTVDDHTPQGDRKTYPADVKIDCTLPVITKAVGDPKVACTTGDCDYWITQNTILGLSASDNTNQCDLGIKYCQWRYTLDGGSPKPWNNITDGPALKWPIQFSDESKHYLEVECFDKAGNKAILTETDKVDTTPPTTTKSFIGPQKIANGVEWIDGVTTIKLEEKDGGLICAIDTDKTYYRITAMSDSACLGTQIPDGPGLMTVRPPETCTPREGTEGFIEYTGPIGGIPESCHMIEFYSVDKLENKEATNTNCFFVDKTPPALVKTVGDPKVDENNRHTDLEMLGNGRVEGTEDKYSTGIGSVKLVIPQEPSGGDFAGVGSFFDVFVDLNKIDALQYDRLVEDSFTLGWSPIISPIIILGVDSNGNGVFDAHPFEWEAGLSMGNANPNLLGGDTFIQCEAQTALTGPDANWVTVDAYKDFSCYTPNVAGNNYNNSVYQPLKYFQTNDVARVKTTDKIAMVKVLLGGNPSTQDNEIAYVDNVVLGASGIKTVIIDEREFTWVTSATPITFSCTDLQPHPSDSEKLCFRVSFDGDEVTDKYCAKYSGVDGQDDFCCKAVDGNKQFVFKFNDGEDSVHSLQYYCKDAVEKKSETVTQDYKVDNTPPVISKNMFGSFLGDCPSGTDLDHGDCYVADNGKSGVTISVADGIKPGADMCVVDKVNCDYQVWWKTDIDTCKLYQGEWDAEGCLIDSGRFLEPSKNVVFSHDSTHDLVVTCQDALGNSVADTEKFLVDSTPPVTTKTYGTPHYPEVIDHNAPHWITSQTPVTLSAQDAKVGVDKIFYRDIYLPGHDEVCNYYMPQKDAPTLLACNPAYYEQLVQGYADLPWTQYMAPFTKSPQSCHVIEYYAVDKLGNKEALKWQCVFVDNTAPLTSKVVGEPKVKCEAPTDDGQCGEGKTYTLNADFDLGTLSGVNYNIPDQLQLTIGSDTINPLMWVANSGEDSVSKWDTSTNKELARYHTWFGALANHGAWDGPAPSRTAVDSDGNVFVANRHFDGKPADVIKILSNDYIDRNSNGVMDTSSDLNSDGYIQPGEMAPAMVDSNSNGKIDPSEITDERVAWVTSVGPTNCLGRALAIDLAGNVWLGCYNTQTYYKLDGTTGAILAGPISVSGHTPYGALIDKYGILWGASLGTNLLRLDTNTNAVTTYSHSQYGSNYGIALGYDISGNTHVYLGSYNGGYSYIEFNSATNTFSVPAATKVSTTGVAVDKDGNIVVANAGNGGAIKFSPAGAVIWNKGAQPGAGGEIRGPVVDSNNDVWIMSISYSKLSKYSGVDGASLGVFNSGLEPYTYSDAAGLSLSTAVSAGTWNVIYDGTIAGSSLGPVSWTETVPTGTTLTVKVRSSENKVAWSPWETVSSGVAFVTTPPGRYLEVQVSMKSTVQDTPILYDLTVKGGCYKPQTTCWFVTQQTPITLNCNDQLPHPVDHSSLFYRYRISDDCKTWGTWTQWIDPAVLDTVAEVTKTFSFTEDSCHELEYYCKDILGNTETVQKEIDIVDTVPPVITTAIEGPKAGTCPATEKDPCFIDGVTNITVSVYDPEPHPVELVTCSWSYTVNGGQPILGAEGITTSEFIVHFPEESNHVLTITCKDGLGNTAIKTEKYAVDKTPPVTTNSYGTPKLSNATGTWITSNTDVTLSVLDAEPHKSGVKETKYRVTKLETNDPCYKYSVCNLTTGGGNFQAYTAPFKIGEDSCHLIEFYSVDNVGKTEVIKKVCVFVDNKAPDPLKTVGEPKTKMTNEEYTWTFYPEVNGKCWIAGVGSIDCWKITTMTPITLDCKDPELHPVDNSFVYFKIGFDGQDLTKDYCTMHKYGIEGSYDSVTGYCKVTQKKAPVTIAFKEESEHNLAYYCEDALGNKGPVDDEKFKVEGSKFIIDLNKKWNLVSVPFVLQDNSMNDIFGPIADKVVSVWGYDAAAKKWHIYTPDGIANDDLNTMVPGEGYWVLARNDTQMVIGGSLFSPGKTPPTKTIVSGWNLIGVYNNLNVHGNSISDYEGPETSDHHEGMPAECALGSLVDTVIGHPKWNSLVTYWEPSNPNQWNYLNFDSIMNPGAGYWLETQGDESYSFSTTCPYAFD